MGDDYNSTIILLEGILEDFLGNHVKMVGGLIHDKEICRRGDHPCQGQPAFLAP